MFGTGTFRYIPISVLGAVVIVAVLPFIKVREAQRLWRVQRADFWVGILAFVGTLLLGLELGVLLAVATSITLIVDRVTRPRMPELGRLPGTDSFFELDRNPAAQTYPDTAIVRVEAPLYFTNAEALANRLLRFEQASRTAHDRARRQRCEHARHHRRPPAPQDRRRYRQQGIRLLLVNVDDEVRAVTDASGLTELVGPDRFFATDAGAVARLGARASS